MDLLFSQNLQSIEFFSRKRQMILFSFVSYTKCVDSIRREVGLNDVALCSVLMCCKVMSNVKSKGLALGNGTAQNVWADRLTPKIFAQAFFNRDWGAAHNF